MIIDEINRAELSRVFGELMYCLEYRGANGAVSTQYSELNDADTAMFADADGYKFFVPSNVYIIGTMNTIDRSVDSFDFALRRRFRWEAVLPDTRLLSSHLESLRPKWVALANNLGALNKAIKNAPLLGEDFQIGHAYLMHLRYPPTMELKEVRRRVWDDSIRPLLEEYLRGSGRVPDALKTFEKEFGIGSE